MVWHKEENYHHLLNGILDEPRCKGSCASLMSRFEYAADITSLSPSSDVLNNSLGVCSKYAETHDIFLNAIKYKWMFKKTY